jgi:hypothetical protein
MINIQNIFSNFDDLIKPKSVADSATAYTKHKYSMVNPTPSLSQGDKFKKFQKKIKRSLETNTLIEGFESNNHTTNPFSQKVNRNDLSHTTLLDQTKNVLNQTHITTTQQSNLNNLKQQYDNILNQYNTLIAEISGESTDYINRVSNNNPYLNKNIVFTTGHVCYVTNQGIVKYIPTMDIWNSIAGINGCPSTSILIQVNLPWLPEYNSPGVIIPTNPPLITGTYMETNQSCGYEGQNVFVNTLVENPTSSYIGCYNNKPPVTTIKFNPIMNSSNSSNGYYAYASSVYQNNNDFTGPWHAFDNDINTFWHSAADSDDAINHLYDINTGVYEGISGVTFINSSGQQVTMMGEYLQLNLPNLIPLTRYDIQGRQDCCGDPNGRDPNTWYILGRKNNDWYEVDYQSNISFNMKMKSFNVLNPQSYEDYIILITLVGGENSYYRSCVQISIWDLYTSSEVDFDDSNSGMIFNSESVGYVTNEQCQQYAVNHGFKYFGQQDAQTDGTSACLVSNDMAHIKMYGEAFNYTRIPLWASYTNNSGITALLSNFGSILVNNSSNTSVYSSPSDSANPGNYLGCYNDCSQGRGLPTKIDGGMNYDSCSIAAKNGNWKYFGIQFTQPNQTSECWVGNDINLGRTMGKASNCTTNDNGIQVGGSCSNAIYSTDSITGSFYFLILQDDGNMCIYRGSNPNDNQGGIWCTMTNGQQQSPDPEFSAAKCKFGRNYMMSGETLAPNEFLGSTDGSIYLTMQTDGNLVLYTSSKVTACSKNSNNNMIGNSSVNAVYQLNQQGYLDNMGKLGFIDNESVLHTYPTSNTKYTNNYTQFTGLDTGGNDIPGSAFSNSTYEQCKSACDNNENCAGFVTNANATVCWPKTNGMYPSGTTQVNNDRNIYVRQKTMINQPIGASNKINNIDSLRFQSYLKDGDIPNTFGLVNATTVQKQQLSQLQDQLNLLSSQIVESTNKLNTGNNLINTQSQKNVSGLQDYLKQMTTTKTKINNFNTNIDNIVNQNDIKTLQQNYNYMFWTILAAGTVLITMNIKK